MSKKSFSVLLFAFSALIILTACLAGTAPAAGVQNAATLAAATVQAAQTAAAGMPGTAAVEPSAPTEEVIPTTAPTETATPTEPPVLPASPTFTPLPAPSAVVRIAYIKNGNVYLWTEGAGGPVGLTGTGDAIDLRISPDAAMIAYIRQDSLNMYHQELWVVNAIGPTNARVLVSADELAALRPEDIPGVGIAQFEWRPRTHEVAYSTLPLFEGPGFDPNHDLRTVNTDTMAKSVLFEIKQAGMFYYSPDGSQIALSKPESISLVNADGSNLRPDVLTFPMVATYSEYQYHPHPVWASDSSSLRVVIPPADTMADPLPPTNLYQISMDGSSVVLLGSIQAMPFNWPDNAFSPDFQHVLYSMMIGERTANYNELHLSNPDGSGESVYDGGESLAFDSWAPDSQRFIYTIYNGPRKSIYLGMIGQPPFILASEPNSIHGIKWVDGQRFAYFGQNGDHWELRISNPGGTNHAFIDTLDNFSSYDIFGP